MKTTIFFSRSRSYWTVGPDKCFNSVDEEYRHFVMIALRMQYFMRAHSGSLTPEGYERYLEAVKNGRTYETAYILYTSRVNALTDRQMTFERIMLLQAYRKICKERGWKTFREEGIKVMEGNQLMSEKMAEVLERLAERERVPRGLDIEQGLNWVKRDGKWSVAV